MAMSKSYFRDDGATMVEVEPHQYVNAKVLRLQGHLVDGQQHDETAAPVTAGKKKEGRSMKESPSPAGA
jgi:hypothetical protein